MEKIGGLGIPLRSLLPTLHCRRVAGVSPLLSIGWWYLSLVSPKRHCCRVSAADKGCRVYPLDPRPDAVALYSGCTPGKRLAWILPDDRHTGFLVGLRGGWRHARTKLFSRLWIQCCCALFLPSTSSTEATVSEPQPLIPVSSDALSTTNNMFTPVVSSLVMSASSSVSGIQHPSESSTIPDLKTKCKNSYKEKKELLKKINETKIEIKMAPDRPQKSSHVEYTT
ncbi:uncharacterized protein TNCV_4594521 [Trichonephila clavipes]|uniref:Uncharacterized protein n=1 Tax=Trichonephila clavipes TaxID=2585209 RepID=A0A8X6WF90_TRICX|nr:uncharacterized protein TNCV_4594521 [Trichonephila clavipes]